jgi:hypothetical protein
VPHVLRVAAFQLGDPVAFIILTETDDAPDRRGAVHDVLILSGGKSRS